MLARPHRNKDAKGGDGLPETPQKPSPSDLFRALAGRLVKVPVEEIREAERQHRADKLYFEPDA